MNAIRTIVRRRQVFALPLLAALLLPWSADAQAPRSQAPAATFQRLPLIFEANTGQTDPAVKFLSRGSGYTLFLTPDEAVLALIKAPGDGTVLRMSLVGAHPDPAIAGLEKLPGIVNYFIGNDPAKWRTNIPTFARVKYQGVYPGVNLVYYGDERQLEYDFVVAPGADPKAITLAFDGPDKLDVDAQGDLILRIASGELRLRKPLVYQEVDGTRKPLAGNYILKAKNQVGFQVAAYDASKPLIIDPVLAYSTFLGGSLGDEGLAIAVDAFGNAYVTGSTQSSDFPRVAALDSTLGGNTDAFVTKLSNSGSVLFSTFLGGGSPDKGRGIAVESTSPGCAPPSGGVGPCIYVTGLTQSANFPITSGAFSGTSNGSTDAFVTKLNSTGSALLYSSFLGGNNLDQGNAIAVDGSGKTYVTGFTTSGGTRNPFPTTTGAFSNSLKGGQDAFVAVLNPAVAGTAGLVYSTFLGGSLDDVGNSIDVGPCIPPGTTACIYVTGSTASGGTNPFPTTTGVLAGYDSTYNGGQDAFIAVLNPAVTGTASLVYSTYFGGGGDDVGNGIAAVSGKIYVTGATTSTSGTLPPTTIAFGPGGGQDAFVAKLDPSAGSGGLLYFVRLGGSGNEVGNGIDLDSAGNIYVTGSTTSTDLLPTVAFGPGGGQDAFVAKLDPSAGSGGLLYFARLGGSGTDAGNGIFVDSSGKVYVVGTTTSPNFPTTSGAFDTTCGTDGSCNAVTDAFVVRLDGAAPIVTLSGAVTASEGETKTYTFTYTFTVTLESGTFTIKTGFPDCGSGGSLVSGSLSTTATGGSFKCSFPDGPANPTVSIQVTDSNGLDSNVASISVTVNNVAPTGTFAAASPISEGGGSSLSLTSPSDPSPADTATGFHYAFACDGLDSSLAVTYAAAGTASTATCPFADNGSFTVKGRIFDKDNGSTTYQATVVVNNVAPTVNTPSVSPEPSNEGSSVIASATFTDPGTNDAPFTCTVNYGDGSGALAGTVTGTTCTGPAHTYADNGSFTVTVAVTDKNGDTGTKSTTHVVNNVAPTVNTPSVSPEPSNEGSPVTASATFTDPGTNDAPFACTVNYGDGSGALAGTVSGATCTGPAHTYADNGSFTVTVAVTDKNGDTSTKSTTHVVNNVAPTATLTNNGPVNEGSLATVSFSNQFDPSSADTAAGFHYAFACDNSSLTSTTYATSGANASTTCTFNNNGNFTVRARIIDQNDGYAEYTTVVTVSNAAPNISVQEFVSTNNGTPTQVFGDITAPEGCGALYNPTTTCAFLSTITLNVSAPDPGTADVVSLTASGLPTGATFTQTSGNPAIGQVIWSPTSGQAGTYIVQFTASDGQASTSKSVTITINDTILDTDLDAIPDFAIGTLGQQLATKLDNCPTVPNPDQSDLDGDGIGDACDPNPNAFDAQVTASVTKVSSPFSSSGHVPGESVLVTVAVTFNPAAAGGPSCYFNLLPNAYNVILKVFPRGGTDPVLANNILEGAPNVIALAPQGSLGEICALAQTFSTDIEITQWHALTPGTYTIFADYETHGVRDPDLLPNGQCSTPDACFAPIWQGTAPAFLTISIGDQCPTDSIPYGQGAGGTGCLYADKITATRKFTNAPISGVQVRVFDRNDPGFQATYGGKNPQKSLYPTIFENNLYRVGQCVTDKNGVAFCGETTKGNFLIIVKALDSTGQIFYDASPTTPIDFDAGGVAAKSFTVP